VKLLLVITAAFLIRLVAALAAFDLQCVFDECFYGNVAAGLAAGEGFQPHAGHYWPPGYIAFLAAHLKTGLGLGGVRITQVFLSTLLVPLAFVMGREAATDAGRQDASRVGLMAAILIAFHPTLIAYSHYLWSETLFLPLFGGGLILVHRAARGGAGKLALGAGVLLGVSCLIKVLPLYLVPLLAIWLALHSPARRRLVVASLLLAGTFLAVAPWTARNYLEHRRLVIIETTTGKNLVRGNNEVNPANWDWGTGRSTRGVVVRTGCPQDDLIDLNACLTRHGMAAITSHPGRFMMQAGTKLADLVNPTSFLVRHIRRDIYGSWPAPLAHGVVTVVALFNMALMAMAVWGWVHHGGNWRQLVILCATYMVAVHLVTFAMSRFRLPLVLPLAVGAALVLVPATASYVPPGSRRQRALWATGLLLVLLLSWGVRVPDLYASRSVFPAAADRSAGD
jgi:4-amino-4-deoxy-L-arabinose transferase-like glycosyltransferase